MKARKKNVASPTTPLSSCRFPNRLLPYNSSMERAVQKIYHWCIKSSFHTQTVLTTGDVMCRYAINRVLRTMSTNVNYNAKIANSEHIFSHGSIQHVHTFDSLLFSPLLKMSRRNRGTVTRKRAQQMSGSVLPSYPAWLPASASSWPCRHHPPPRHTEHTTPEPIFLTRAHAQPNAIPVRPMPSRPRVLPC